MIRHVAAAAMAAVFCGTALADKRPAIKGVSTARISNYGSPSMVVKGKDVEAILADLNELRGRSWSPGDIKMTCYSTVILLRGEKRVGEFRVKPDIVVERPVEKADRPYTLLVNPADIAGLSRLLAGITPAKDCN